MGPAKPVTPPAKTPDNKKPEKTDNGAQDKWVDASKDPAVTKKLQYRGDLGALHSGQEG